MFIVYSSHEEVIVCTPDTEPTVLHEWFEQGGRDLDDFDREVLEGSNAVFVVSSRLTSSACPPSN